MEKIAPQAKKEGSSLLGPLEQKFIKYWIPRLPKWLSSVHLTNMTLVWCIGVLVFSWIAKESGQIAWLWGVSLMIFAHWVSDSLDGSLGRHRGEGLVKWGFYMDHFYDYIFLGCLLLGYCFIMPKIVLEIETINLSIFQFSLEVNYYYLMFYIMMILGGFMVNSFLYFGATQKFKIAYMGIGPTEIRIVFIYINTMIILIGRTLISWTLPYVLILLTLGLMIMIYRTQKELHALDKHIQSQK